jgi:hypothetical protein
MRVNRRFLYWGIFLVAVGAVLVAVDLRGVDESTLANALGLWPLAFIAIGLGLVLRRTQFSLAGGMIAAAVPGLLLGALMATPHFTIDCGGSIDPVSFTTREGTFAGPARIDVTTGCGSLTVTTTTGNGWELQAGNTENRAPRIDASANRLSIDAGGRHGWNGFGNGRDSWRLALPTSTIDDLSLVINAGEGKIDLPGATIGVLDLTTNAGATTVDLGEASIEHLTGTVNAGALSVTLPGTADLSASMEINAGGVQVCTPSDLGLRIHHTGVLSGISVNGQHLSGSDWESPDYASAAHHADFDVSVNLGNIEFNPTGGCK